MSEPALRPRWTPRRRLLNLPRTSSGARETCGPPCWVCSAVPSIRLALGTRRGRPEGVTPPLRLTELLGPFPALVVRRAPAVGAVPVGLLVLPLVLLLAGRRSRIRPVVATTAGLPVLLAAAARQTGVGQLVADARDRLRTLEAYAFRGLRGRARNRFRLGGGNRLISVLETTLYRPIVLVGRVRRRRVRLGVLLLLKPSGAAYADSGWPSSRCGNSCGRSSWCCGDAWPGCA